MLNYVISFVKSFLGKTGPPLMVAHPRSSAWPKTRDEHLEMEPTCQACGTKKNLSVHHIMPYHLDRSKELDPKNLITLCEEHHCHLVFGHFTSWYSYNPTVREDVIKWLERVKNRP